MTGSQSAPVCFPKRKSSDPAGTAQTLTLKVNLTERKSKTLIKTFSLTLKAGQAGNTNYPITVSKSTKIGLYSLTLDVYLGASQIGTSSAQFDGDEVS
jgi:hypothetical protein